MARLPLIGGAYSARSIIAACTRAINYFPEVNPKDSPVPLTHYQRPGLVKLAQGKFAPCRELYQASNGNGYAVIGDTVYSVAPPPAWTLTALGTITAGVNTPTSMIDNGQTILLVDGSPNGWTIDLGTNAFSLLNDPTGAFQGATRVDTLDTFTVWNFIGTPFFGSSLGSGLGGLLFDPTYIAQKAGYPDPIISLIVNKVQIYLMGRLKSEIWFSSGGALFPFARLPGTYIEHGLGATYSLAASDVSIFWLHQDLQGLGMILRVRGYEVKRISNHALELAMAKMPIISDAIGYVYQFLGHTFYVLHFPQGNQTWVYDDAIIDPMEAWHQECWTDNQGNLNRHRANCYANLYSTHVVGDWANGTLYQMSKDAYTDQVEGVVGPISWIRTFPHIQIGMDAKTRQPQLADGKNIIVRSFTADIECGMAPLDAFGNPGEIWMRYSRDRGRTYGEALLQNMGAPGEYMTQPDWGGLGASRDPVIEIGHSLAGPAALNGGWIDASVMEN